MNHITAIVTYGNDVEYATLDKWQQEANPWTITLRYRRRQMRVNYWTGQGITTDPSAVDVLESLCMDASGADQSFDEWCSDYGYDTDSRKAERTYRSVQEQTRRLRRLLGDDFDEIVSLDDDERAARCK